MIFENISAAYNDGTNLDARRNMLHASFYAGCAFTKSYVGYVHAVAHSLGGEYNMPHGLANAILLPFVLEAYGKSIHKKLYRLALAAGVAKKDMPYAEAANRFIAAIKDMKKWFDIGDTVASVYRGQSALSGPCVDGRQRAGTILRSSAGRQGGKGL